MCPKVDTPECPGTSADPTAISESTIACSASLVICLMASHQDGKVTLIYPLSQAELQFVLEKLGVGSQQWKDKPEYNNIPKVVRL
jgi:hypothetical protein